MRTQPARFNRTCEPGSPYAHRGGHEDLSGVVEAAEHQRNDGEDNEVAASSEVGHLSVLRSTRRRRGPDVERAKPHGTRFSTLENW